jgi:protocatechuate 3,4-dioxygenase beta subunit
MSSKADPLQGHPSQDDRSLILPSRRSLIGSAFAAGALGVAGGDAFAQELQATPECHDEPTEAQIEGPFYTPRSPERAELIESNARGRVVELSGFVLTRGCQPVPRVLVDLWHADDLGDYDNRGYRYRGHIITDSKGQYRFRTNLPGLYPGRTRHFHLKVLSVGRQLLTTQLYFPNEAGNLRDDFFRPDLVMRTADAGRGAAGQEMAARFDIVLNLR